MLRKIYLRNTKTGETVQFPVTPPDFSFESGRNVESLEMAHTGESNLPGLLHLFNQQKEFLLPAESGRSYADPAWDGKPYVLVEKLVGWSNDGAVLRLMIPGTSVTYPVLLGPVIYGEADGTNDVTVKLTFRRYRYLGAETYENAATGNAGRASESAQADTAVCTVVSGDTLWGICRKYYGDGSLCYKLAAYNGIKNANLISVGQRITVPDRSLL